MDPGKNPDLPGETKEMPVQVRPTAEQFEEDSLILANAKIRFLKRIRDALKHEKGS